MDKTIEEQIINAGIEFTKSINSTYISSFKFDDIIKDLNRNAAFEAGAKWAYEHFKNN